MKYENRVVFFLDIFGFKKFINSTIDSFGNDIDNKIDEVYEIFNAVRYFLDEKEYNKISQTKKFTQFSDSMVVSFKANERSEIYHTLYYIQLLLTHLVSKDILCRGAVAYGKLLHDDNFIFGPALNMAYLGESKAALFPRIILDKSIISLGGIYHAHHHLSHHEIEAINNIVSKDTDNMYYIDYFGKSIHNFYDADSVSLYVDDLRKLIAPYLDIEDPDLKVKYGWVVNKFNKMLRKIRKSRNYKCSDLSEIRFSNTIDKD